MSAAKVKETPMMSQYNTFKRRYPDAILLFRVGDFYETFSKDAIEVAEITGITLTKRGNGSTTDIALAGFPHHALDTYLPKLVSYGKRVAICDQIEDPKMTKTLVKRDVTELVTPGLSLHDTTLEARSNNFLSALVIGDAEYAGAAFLDLSTGEFVTLQGNKNEIEKVVAGFNPSEILYLRGGESEIEDLTSDSSHLYPVDEWVFSEEYGRERLQRHFGVSHLKGFGLEEEKLSIIACGVILYYLDETKHTNISHITTLRRLENRRFVQLDKFTLRNLEILNPISEDGVSLFQILDKSRTPMGGRLLKRWLLFPLLNIQEIQKRQDAVNAFYNNSTLAREITTSLSGIGDLERLISKVAVNRISPRELLQVAYGLKLTKPIIEGLHNAQDKRVIDLALKLDALPELKNEILKTINPDAPAQLGRGVVISSGVSPELDELRDISGKGKQYLSELRNRESEKTGIPSLKVAFNNVFGYYIEVTNAHKDKVPPEWIRKQTLVNAERYITEELKEYEQKILGAEERIAILEQELYNKLVLKTLQYISPLQENAMTLATIDVLLSFAEVALHYNYTPPIVDDSDVIDIHGGRHPVIERLLPSGEEYVSNDLYLDPKEQQIIVITGPNMSGKSALLRQTALIALLAQVGSFVPATSARIGIVDKIFTRVGASDNISRGESTFMVEMIESASILNNLTPKSLILVDELGRGTSTYDGISIARAILEYLHEHPKGHTKTLFATHYHELNELEGVYPRIKNYNVTVKETGDKVIFLRKLEKGGSEHSFGIHVAQMAGMPKPIVQRAKNILSQLEENALKMRQSSTTSSFIGKETEIIPEDISGMGRPVQLSFFQLDDPLLSNIREEITGININDLTPLEALNKLDYIQRLLTKK